MHTSATLQQLPQSHFWKTKIYSQLNVNPKLLEKIFAAPQLCPQLAIR